MICYGKDRTWLLEGESKGAKTVGFPDKGRVSAGIGESAHILTGGLSVCTAVGVAFEDEGVRKAYLQHYFPSMTDESLHQLTVYLARRSQKLLGNRAVRVVIVAPEEEMTVVGRDQLLQQENKRVSAWPDLRQITQRYLFRLFEPEVIPYTGESNYFGIYLPESGPSTFYLNGQDIPETSLLERQLALSGRL